VFSEFSVQPNQQKFSAMLAAGQFAHICHAKIARRVTLSQALALVPSGKSKLRLAHPALSRGAYRDRHET
jgi:hypothetical protein